MQIEVENIPNSKILLIPVAEENIKVMFVSEISKIRHGNKIYKVFDYFVYEKKDLYPAALMRMALGVFVEPEKIWKKYVNSNIIYLFVCEFESEQKEEVKEIEEVKEVIIKTPKLE